MLLFGKIVAENYMYLKMKGIEQRRWVRSEGGGGKLLRKVSNDSVLPRITLMI